MNAVDDLMLMAYLDDELAPEERESVEAALRADPTIADRLAALAPVGDLLALLSKPEPAPDVSGAVVAAIHQRRREAARRLARLGPMVAALAAAAVLLMIYGAQSPRPPATVAPEPAVAQQSHRITAPPAPTIALAPRPARPAPVVRPAPSALPAAVVAGEVRARDARTSLDGLVREGDVRRVDVVVDELDGARLDAMDGLVRTTPRMRPPYARIRVVQGVELDPTGPGKPVVYVMVMDGHEYAQFRRNVGRALPDAEVGPPRQVRDDAEALAGLGSVEFIRKVDPAGTLTPPPFDPTTSIARRAHPREGHGMAIVTAEGQILHSGGGLVRPKGPLPAEASPGERPRPSDEAEDASVRRVYVVWVSPREKVSR